MRRFIQRLTVHRSPVAVKLQRSPAHTGRPSAFGGYGAADGRHFVRQGFIFICFASNKNHNAPTNRKGHRDFRGVRFLSVFFICVLCGLIFSFSGLASAAEVVDKIIAEVNGVPITYREIAAPLAGRLAALRDTVQEEEYEKEAARLIRNALEDKIKDMLFLSEARRRLSEEEVAAVEVEVEKLIQEAVVRAGSRENLENELRASGTSLEKETKLLRDRTLVTQFLQKTLAPRIRIAPKEVLDFYQAHLAEFQENEKVKIRQILTKFSEYEDKDAARKVAEDLRKRLDEGADFAHLAQKYSRGPYAEKGGEWEFLERGNLLPEVDKWAFDLPLGAVSDIIETGIGFSIIKVEGRKRSRTIPFEEVEEWIGLHLWQQKFYQEMERYYQELRQKATVVIRLEQ
jgi:parvulin-like peptidyl-prolyl isomerase